MQNLICQIQDKDSLMQQLNDRVQNQAEAMRAGLTDESIDILVDSVRLSRSDRDTLKQLIKARRDYILSWAETQKDLL